MKYSDCSKTELLEEQKACLAAFEGLKEKYLKLDMSRGKPGREQLDMVSDILTVLNEPEDCFVDGMDARNYGGLAGLPSASLLTPIVLPGQPPSNSILRRIPCSSIPMRIPLEHVPFVLKYFSIMSVPAP